MAKNVRQFLTSEVTNTNPHATRISAEHSYTVTNISAKGQGRKPKLPDLLIKWADEQAASTNTRQISNDGVLDYASAVLNDGLILLELRDAIHKGDG